MYTIIRLVGVVFIFMQSKMPQEYGEVILYEVMIMTEAGNYEEALRHLVLFESDICDILGLMEAKGNV